jgi:peptidoglycan hydrolase-like protein with peptidoglycan-binding domain
MICDPNSSSVGSRGPVLLRRGDCGLAVAQWQRQLNRVHRSKVAVDGIFGPATECATRAFQKAHGISVDGVVGTQTRLAMKRTLSS